MPGHGFTHEDGLEGRLHFPGQQIFPVDVSKERMSLLNTKKQNK